MVFSYLDIFCEDLFQYCEAWEPISKSWILEHQGRKNLCASNLFSQTQLSTTIFWIAVRIFIMNSWVKVGCGGDGEGDFAICPVRFSCLTRT